MTPVHGRVIRPSRLPAVGPSGCLRPLAVTLPTVENGRTECVRLWRDSERFMEACRPAIDAIASALLASGRLSYDEVAKLAAAAMKDSPDPAIPWWAPRLGAPVLLTPRRHPLKDSLDQVRCAVGPH